MPIGKPKQRKIIHIDMDCFYAAVEMRDNPAYRNKPIAVGGDGPRSVLCTCNYAARAFGVRSAMPAMTAKSLCPELLIVNGRMSVYQDVSRQVHEIFRRYTSIIEPLSLDEAYLDVTDSTLFGGSATRIAEAIRCDIFNELQLTASAGVATNKFIAKIASDENKPNGICVIPPDKVDEFVADLPLIKIPGVGPKTAQRLMQAGLVTCRDVRASTPAALQLLVGKQAESLYQRSFGKDCREVVTHRERKTVGVEKTLAQDIAEQSECRDVIQDLLPKLKARYDKHQARGISKLTVKLKFDDFALTTVEQQAVSIEPNLFESLLQRALERSNGRKIRLVGISVGLNNLTASNKESDQLSLPI
ncbi:DNA polymerase IV [Thalassotalea fusca]